MTITKERAEILTNVLTTDINRTKTWLVLAPEVAVAEINALGYDFTAAELAEYGEAMKASVTQGELSEDELDNVAGGIAPWLIYAGALGVAALCGVAVGGLEKSGIW